MQRSLQGLMCTLLYALLIQMPSLVEHVSSDGDVWKKRTQNDWSIHDLERTFCDLFKKRSQPLCVFIDGLDEIDSEISNGQINLISLIKRLSNLNGIKFCVASRPETVLKSQLSEYPQMKLQDLTRRDILRLVTDRLNTPTLNDWIDDQLHLRDPDAESEQNYEPSVQNLVKTITSRAEGIFLWVCLVTQSILSGSLALDSWKLVLGRIEALPTELESLYEDLWTRQKDNWKFYRSFTAVYLNT
ncbi:hypothetical protein DM02DRAFT_576353, partial [Periconia macrospinosa]